MHYFRHIRAVIAKDLQLELRSKYALNTVLAFVGSSLLVTLFALKAHQLEAGPQSGLIWIIILFAALSTLSRSFVLETERHTIDLLRLHCDPFTIYAGKLIYNFLFSLFVNLITFVLYILLIDVTIQNYPAFWTTLFLGTVGIAGVTTLMAAIVSRADRRGAIFSVLSLPLLIPLILILARTTRASVITGISGGFTNDVAALVGFAGVTITAGILLFDFIWKD